MKDKCQVCGLLANGSHYSACSFCYASKEFFRRAVNMLRDNKILELSTKVCSIVSCKIIRILILSLLF